MPISLSNKGRLSFFQAVQDTFSGEISVNGNVELTKGHLILTGNNSWKGTTYVESGVLEVNTQSIPNNPLYILAPSTVILNQTKDGIFLGPIQDKGHFIKRGLGNLTLKGNKPFQVTITIEEGTLTLDNTGLQADKIKVGLKEN